MRMHDPRAIRDFIRGGRAVFTLVSARTKTRFTYKLSVKKDDAEVFYLKVLCAPDLYKFAGVVTTEGTRLSKYDLGRELVYKHSFNKGQLSADAPSVRAFAWFLQHVQDADVIHPDLEFWHEGKCARCGRALTVPQSIATGFGPECAAAKGIEMKEAS